MSDLVRAVDNTGAAWPVTGRRCPVCRMPVDPAAGATHPGCDPGPPISDLAPLLAALVRAVGATNITSERNAAA